METLTSSLALVAAISGRDALTSKEMLALDGVMYVGSHGLDRWRNGWLEVTVEARPYLELIQGVAERLGHDLDMTEFMVENKGVSIGIHYRLSQEPHQAREIILNTLDHIPEVRGLLVTEGKLVVEVRPPAGVDKGTSLESLVTEYGLKGVIYLGDDLTDVDAFKTLHALSYSGRCLGLALGVLGEDVPAEVEQEADLLLADVSEVEKLLQWLAEALPPTPPAIS